MSYRSIILGTICAAALSAIPLSGALANPVTWSNFHATVGGEYSHSDVTTGGSFDTYGVDGAASVGFGDSDFAGQANVGYHHIDASGFNLNIYNVGGSLFWAPTGGALDGRAGATFNYDHFNTPLGNINVKNYGGFAQWYLNHTFTFSAKGGGFDASYNIDGYYLGAQLKAYLCPNLAASGSIDHVKLNNFSTANETDYTFEGEWMFSQEMPVSVYAGYVSTDLSGTSSNLNTYLIGLRFYLDGNGATDLRDRQRSGTLGWAASFNPRSVF